VHAVDVGVVALAEDHAVEGPVELHADAHQILFALHLQVADLRHVVGLADLPGIAGAGRGGAEAAAVSA